MGLAEIMSWIWQRLRSASKYVGNLPLWVGVAAYAAWHIFWTLHEARAGSVRLQTGTLKPDEELSHEQDKADVDGNDSLHNYTELRDQYNKNNPGGNT